MKKMLKSLVSLFRMDVIVTIPGGILPDNQGAWGLFGFMQNVNAALDRNLNTVATSGTAVSITADQLSGILNLTSGATGGFTINLPTTAAILARLGNTIPMDGSFAMTVSVLNNNVGQTGTLTAGDASTTISGTATIATNTVRDFVLTVNSNSTITITNIGTKTL